MHIVQIYYRSNSVVLDILITLYFQLGHPDQSPPETSGRDTQKKSETVKGEQGTTISRYSCITSMFVASIIICMLRMAVAWGRGAEGTQAPPLSADDSSDRTYGISEKTTGSIYS